MKAPTLSSADITTIGLIMKYGKAKFTLGETAKILHRGADDIAAYLHERGVTVERHGRGKSAKKLVQVAEIARISADRSQNVAAIRTD